MKMKEAEWIKSCLQPGEELLWSGKPEALWWEDRNALWIGFGALLLILSVCLMLPFKAWSDENIMFCVVALLGLVGMVGVPYIRRRRMQHTLYALTNSRAIIWTHKRMKSYPLRPYMVLEHEPAHKGNPGRLLFAHKLFLGYPTGCKEGFRNLADTEEVLQPMRERLGSSFLLAENMPLWEKEKAEALPPAQAPLRACLRIAIEVALALLFIRDAYKHITTLLSGDECNQIFHAQQAVMYALGAYAMIYYAAAHTRMLLRGRRLLRESASETELSQASANQPGKPEHEPCQQEQSEGQ